MEVLGNSSNIFSKMVVKELIEWFFLKEEGENIQTVGPHSLLQAHHDEMKLVVVVLMKVTLLLLLRLFSS